MLDQINEVITDSSVFSKHCIMRNGFVFTAITHPANVYNAIVIKNPNKVRCFSPRMDDSTHSLEEHIELINKYKLEKALIIADNIDFITRCPTLKQVSIVPADTAGNDFDYSPLYRMPEIKNLHCAVIYGFRNEFSTSIDYSKINGIEDIHVSDSNHKNYENLETLKSLGIRGYKKENINELFSSKILDTLYYPM